MSVYPAPTRNAGIFNPTNFGGGDSSTITTSYLDANYLKISGGQTVVAKETFSGGIKTSTIESSNGVVTLSGTSYNDETEIILADNNLSSPLSVRSTITGLDTRTAQISRFTDSNGESATQIGGLKVNTAPLNASWDSYVKVDKHNFSLIGENSTTVLYADLSNPNTSGIGTNRVGIKTTSPAYDLDVNGNMRVTGNLQLTTDRPWLFKQVGSGSSASLALQSTYDGKSFNIQDVGGNSFCTFWSHITNPSVSTTGNVSVGKNLTVTGNVTQSGGTTTTLKDLSCDSVTSSSFVKIGSSGVGIWSGSGSPEGVTTAPVGSMYLRSDGGAGTSLYVKQSGTGNTGWAAK